MDSVNVFHLIEEILSQPKNNPVYQFERYTEVENWLREQWAGMFKELLTRMSSQQQLSSLSGKVSELGEINMTLKRYLETIIEKVTPKEFKGIIESESKRLEEMTELQAFKKMSFFRNLYQSDDYFAFKKSVEAVRNATSFIKLVELLTMKEMNPVIKNAIERAVLGDSSTQDGINKARELMGLKRLPIPTTATSKTMMQYLLS